MDTAILWTIFALSWIIALARFADFLLGVRGQRRLKDRLVAWYVAMAEAPWHSLPHWFASRGVAFFSVVFGPRIVHARAILVTVVLSTIVNGIYCVFIADFSISVAQGMSGAGGRIDTQILRPAAFATDLAMIFICVAVVHDVLSVMVSRALLSRIALRRSAWLFLLFDVGMAAVLWLSALSAATIAFQFGLDYASESHAIVRLHPSPALADDVIQEEGFYAGGVTRNPIESFVSAFLTDYPTAWREALGLAGWIGPSAMTGIRKAILFSATTVLLPTLFFMTVIALTLALIRTRRVTEPVLLLVLQRLEEARGGVFTTLAMFLSAMVGLISAGRALM